MQNFILFLSLIFPNFFTLCFANWKKHCIRIYTITILNIYWEINPGGFAQTTYSDITYKHINKNGNVPLKLIRIFLL